ncbi:hypothetical protein [Okeania hirsuta]|nr:hypothetical protein [Okeania hirsuta]
MTVRNRCIVTSAACSANVLVRASPIPLLPPVIKICLSFKS